MGEMYSMKRTFGPIINGTNREARVKPSNDMPGIPQETIDRVLDSTNIVELIGSFVALKKIGQNFQGLCPFHDDKTPSLSVSPEKKIFRCFGCGASGNAITFLRRHKNLPFPEAVRFLAGKARIPMDTDEDKKRELFLSCLAKAQEQFATQLRSLTYRSAVNYLTERGINQATQEEFALGYAGSVKDVIAALKQSGIKKEGPLGVGLLKEKEQGITCPFMGRIIFPLTDQRGATVGFGGRAIDSSSQAKYINSPDSVIFNKRRVLFGLKQLRISNDTVLVVEGYFDVLTLHQAGFKNTGRSSRNRDQRLSRCGSWKTLARNAILIFDGDSGGQTALLKCLKVAASELDRKGGRFYRKAIRMRLSEAGRIAEFEALIEKAKPTQRSSDRDHHPAKRNGEHRASHRRSYPSRS